MNLNGTVPSGLLSEGRNFLKDGRVKALTVEKQESGCVIRAKTVDMLNCVDRVEVCLSENQNTVLSFSCTCPEHRNTQGRICKRCAAVIITGLNLSEQSDNGPMQPENETEAQPEMQPENETEVQPEMQPENEVKPEIQPENETEVQPEMQPENETEVQPEMQPAELPEDNNSVGLKECSSVHLKDIRVYIGDDQKRTPVYWEFGNPQLGNRHLLITGTSGQGKTYCIQTMLQELASQGIPCFIFDYTDGFLPGKLEPEFEAAMQGKITQQVAIINHIPLNPFLKREMEIPGLGAYTEETRDVAGRLADILCHVYDFGEQQRAALYKACKEGIDLYGDQMTFSHLQECLEASTIREAKSVLSKMVQFFDNRLFDFSGKLDWGSILQEKGHITVFQLTGLDKKIQTIITEILLWDAWYYFMKAGDKNHPFVVVLDEAQCLSFKESAPAARILREGRKYGWSAWFATQFTKGALSTEEISLLQQAAEQLAFKPTGEEMNQTASRFAELKNEADRWVSVLKNMKKGECIVQGDRILENGEFGHAEAVLVKVASFDERAERASHPEQTPEIIPAEVTEADYCDVSDNAYSGDKSYVSDGYRKSHYIDETITSCYQEKPVITFEDLVGVETISEKLVDIVDMRDIDSMCHGVLLYGCPGTGKTAVVQALANYMMSRDENTKFLNITGIGIMNRYVGEDIETIHAAFHEADHCAQDGPCILMFDDMDSLFRGNSSDPSDCMRSAAFVEEFHALADNYSQVFVIGTTNAPWEIDSNVLSCFKDEEMIYFPLPDCLAREQFFEQRLQNIQLEDNLTLAYMAENTEHFNFRNIRLLIDDMLERFFDSAFAKKKQDSIEFVTLPDEEQNHIILEDIRDGVFKLSREHFDAVCGRYSDLDEDQQKMQDFMNSNGII